MAGRILTILKLLILAALITIVRCFEACNKPEEVPAYIHVATYDILATPGFGTSSSLISDVWVYENDNLQGVYELPTTFPILSSGQTKLKLLAGVKVNGIASTRVAYPFYGPYETEIMLTPAKTDTLHPSTGYITAVVRAFMADFETGNPFQHIERLIDSSLASEGKACGRLHINVGDSVVLAYSNIRFAVPFTTDAVFLEMDYKNNSPFTVGIRGYLNAQMITAEKLTINPKERWNKIYINFTPEVRRIQASEYEVIFKYVGSSTSVLPDILLDNIKLLYL